MFLGLGRKIAAIFHPFAVIASELQIIRELYELELASRPVPIRRVTETPSKDDTEVSYVGDDPKRKIDFFEDLEEDD